MCYQPLRSGQQLSEKNQTSAEGRAEQQASGKKRRSGWNGLAEAALESSRREGFCEVRVVCLDSGSGNAFLFYREGQVPCRAWEEWHSGSRFWDGARDRFWKEIKSSFFQDVWVSKEREVLALVWTTCGAIWAVYRITAGTGRETDLWLRRSEGHDGPGWSVEGELGTEWGPEA